MERDDLAPYVKSLQRPANFINLMMFAGMAVAAVAIGLFVFVKAGNSEADVAAKMQSILAGEVQPEKLTIVRKYSNASRHGTPYRHVILRGSRPAEINSSATLQFYDSVDAGSTVTGYYFPEGYFIPDAIGHDQELAKWAFLGSGVLMGAIFGTAAWRGWRKSQNSD
ncbi:MAG TPA: hypothetical protein VFE46_17445 [Pirellulales bacterium]|jgi:hypothetical protein|nr:hypothetical protein [Pirellulales bacterium]